MLYFCVLSTVLILIIGTCWVWIPLLLASSPLWLGGLFLMWGLGMFNRIYRTVSDIYDWIFFKSDKPRRYFWQKFYSYLAWQCPSSSFKCMNYGFGVNSESGVSIDLEQSEQSECFSYQLYHYAASKLKKVKSLKGLKVLDVGSGRGGGTAFVQKYFQPDSIVGVDYCQRQVHLCKRMYRGTNIQFKWGDAEDLPIDPLSVDMVLCIESAHTFGNFKQFLTEVDRVLCPKGDFVIADFIAAPDLKDLDSEILGMGYTLVSKQEITENVLIAMRLDTERRNSLIENKAPPCLQRLLRRFAGLEGSNMYNQFEAGDCIYMVYHLTKPSP